jgi:uncharacterized repeat protein (TIGR01451 family)/LPXTG-motif cell wall-anchored protein
VNELRRTGRSAALGRRAKVVAAITTTLIAVALTQPVTGIPILPERTALAFVCPTPVALVNGSFELPDIPNGTLAFPSDAAVPGWSTTSPDGLFEFWGTGFGGVPSADGNQFIELNAFFAASVFQTIDTSTLQGQTIEYSFFHRGRAGVDTMRLQIGPAAEPPNFTRQVSTGNTAWVQYTGTYTVPVGQTVTRFSYGAVSTATGNVTVGNFLDGIAFGTPPCATDLSVIKTGAPSPYLPGEPVTFTIVITNTGEHPQQFDIVGASLVDTVPAAITDVTWSCSASAGSSCGAAGGSGNSINTTYDILEGGTVSYTVTGTAPISGTPDPLANTATVSLPAGVTETNPANNAATASIPLAVASLNLVKSSDSETVPLPPGTITYRFSVTNDGDVPLTNVTVTDPRIGSSLIDCGSGTNVIPTFAVGATVVCTAVYPVTVPDLAGITNTATATGIAPPGIPPPSDSSTFTIPFSPAPAVEVDKTSDAVEPVNVGDVVTYSYAVTNTGNVPLDNVTVTDGHGGLSTIDCGGDGNNVIEQMFPGGPVTCTATYTVSQADVDSGSIGNTGSVTGTPTTGGGPVSDTDPLTIDTADASPALSIDKTADTAGPVSVGDTIAYSFEVANTGNVTLSDVTVTDPLPDLSPVDCGGGSNVIATLAPADGPVICTAAYTVTQADVDSGAIANFATVTGNPPGSDEPITPAGDDLVIPAAQVSALTLVKTADPAADPAVGDTITYSFTVDNTGTVTLSDVTVSDTSLPGLSAIDCGDGTNVIAVLAPADTPVQCTATYTVAQDDVDAGQIINTATATGTPPATAPPLTPVEGSATVLIERTAAMTFAKSASPVAGSSAGDVITYSFAVTNTGTVTLTNVTVSDPMTGLSPIDCGDDGDNVIATLTPQAGTVTCTATYTLTQADVDAGNVANTATASGTPPSGAPPLEPVDGGTNLPIGPTPALSLNKDSDVTGPVALGQVITYSLTVTNTGNVTLSNVTVTDSSLPGMSAIDCGGGSNVIATLAPSDPPVVCTATYSVTQADLDAASISNTASVTGTPPGSQTPIPPTSDTEVVDSTQSGGLTLEKASTLSGDAAGEVIRYTFVVTNSGAVTLSNVTVSDLLPGLSAVDCGGGGNSVPTLAPSGSATCTATYELTQSDVDRGSVVNTATAGGTDPGGNPVEAEDTVTTPVAGSEGIMLDKTSGGINDVDGNGVDAGDTITYFFVVTNTGSSTLDGITVNDPRLGGVIPCGSGPLAPGAFRECGAAVYTLTDSDFATTLENSATVSGTTPGGEVLSGGDVAITVIPPACSVVTTTTTTADIAEIAETTEPTEATETSGPTAPALSATTSTSSTTTPELAPTSSTPAETDTTDATETTETTTETTIASTASTIEPTTGPAGLRQTPTQVDPCAPPPTTSTSTTLPSQAGGGGGTLPATGRDQDSTAAYAIALLIAGLATLALARRRHPVD